MKRLAAVAVVALALAGSASADVFRVVPSVAPTSPAFLPSAEMPNTPGSISFPPRCCSGRRSSRSAATTSCSRSGSGTAPLYGVPWQVLAAINKIESNFGRNMGPSSAGAIGWMQFMPSTWERWGVDADGDGLANPWSAEDAIAAAARYLAASGGATDISRAVFSYNHAQWYVDEVLQLAQLFGSGGVDATFNLDRLQVSLEQNRQAVVHANRKLLRAERDAARAQPPRGRARTARGVGAPALRPARARPARRQLGVRVSARAGARVAAAAGRLAQAQAADLARARPLASASFAPARRLAARRAGLRRPVRLPGRRRPLARLGLAPPSRLPRGRHRRAGGLAGLRARRRDRRALVATPDGRCGIGLTIDTADGQEWTYCHLSYLDPAVTAGAQLAAGTQVGLVGMTGHATGPHLHLQLDPATSYPQLQPWFQNFAGVAFRWQDAGPTDSIGSAGHAPVFAVVPTANGGIEWTGRPVHPVGG